MKLSASECRAGLTSKALIRAAVLLVLSPALAVQAQEAEKTVQLTQLEEVVVTGTAGGAEIRKLDASFSITTADAAEIGEFSAASTADLLKLVPGIWSESSGGVAGANVFVRGFPGGGDAPFLTVQLNGSPVFPPPTLSFLENTTLFRIDETVARMEALRGGPNPVFGSGQPGLTTNFILREGGEETEGLAKFTTSDYDLRRFDGYLSGKLADEFYYMVGGYISSSPGVRDAGFNAEEGNQFTVNLKKYWDGGSVNLYTRMTDDHGTWYLPAALNVPGIDASYTQVGTLNRQRQIMFGSSDPQVETLDLGEGRGWDGSISGGSIRLDMSNDWELVDRFNFTSGKADTLGLVPNGGAVQVGALLANPAVDPGAVVTGPLTGAVTGDAIGSAEYIQQFGAWVVRKDIESFTNDISLAKQFDKVKLTVGYYTANASTDEFWSLGNQKYQVVRAGGEVVDGIACNALTVDSCGWGYDIDATGDATTNALYAATEVKVSDRLTLDFGLRREKHEVEYSVDEGLTGVVSKAVAFDEAEISWTAAGNYMLTDNSGVFLRINSGQRMPYFDDFRDNYGAYQGGNLLIQDVDQYELGYKFVGSNFAVYATGFYTKVDPSIFVALAGVTPGQISTNEAYGIELDGNYYSDTGLAVNLNATIQESEIKSGVDAGNQAQRQPGWQVRVTPSYTFNVRDSSVKVFGTVSAVDDRFSDNGNTVVLPGYEKVDLGVIVDLNESLTIQVAADNITDEQGLTEGDPRNPAAPNGRFILPRNVKLSVGYRF